MRSLAAFRLGFESYRLRALQETLWATNPADALNLDDCLRQIDHDLLVLSENINDFQQTRYDDLRLRLIDRHEMAAKEKGRILSGILSEHADPADAFARLPALCQSEARFFIVKQEEDRNELRQLTIKAVRPDTHLCARWEIGYGLATRVHPPRPSEIELPSDDALPLGIEKLDPKEQKAVEHICADRHTPETWEDAYHDLVEFFGKTLCGSATQLCWNPVSRKLWVGIHFVAQWKNAVNQRGLQLEVLNQLQSQGWPSAIENPFVDQNKDPAEWWAREAVKGLNAKTREWVHFSASKASISWELVKR